jgi:hypothetical protein
MTAFGKLLVFVQFILSIVFLTWAIGLYSQRIDWAPGKTLLGDPIPEVKGRVGELADEIKTFVGDAKDKDGSRDKAELRWQTAYQGLADATKSREEYQRWYKDQLSLAQRGEDTLGRRPADAPVRHLVYNPNGTLKMDPDLKVRPAVQSFGAPVKSVEDYYKESDQLQKDVEKAQEKLYETVVEAEKITREIVGSPTNYGLRRNLRDEEAYYRNALEEQRYLEPVYNGRTAEFEVVKKRNAQLERRKQELSAAAAAANRQ